MRNTLHLPPVTQIICYRIAAIVWRCLVGIAQTSYLQELCCPVSLWWAVHSLDPRVNTSTAQRCTFSVIAPSIWNEPPLEKRLLRRPNTPLLNVLDRL